MLGDLDEERCLQGRRESWRIGWGAGLGVFGNGADFEEFLLGFGTVVSTNVLKDLLGFFEATDRYEAARGVGKKLDTCEEQESGEALEGKEESPSDW
jgi:hypothetical protein